MAFSEKRGVFYVSVRCAGSGTNSVGSIDMSTRIVTVIGDTVTGLDGVASRR